MKENNEKVDDQRGKLSVNFAILGGGGTSKKFLSLLQNETLSYLNMRLVGVCDIDPEAETILLAKEKGIYTTDNFHDLFGIKDLDAVIEFTNNRELHLELVRHKPKGLIVLEHKIVGFLEKLLVMNQRLKSAEQQVALEKMASDYLIQQVNERIMVLSPDFTIVEANDAYLKAVGKTRDEVIGAHCYEITHGLSVPCSSSQPELGCPMLETLRTGEPAQVIHEHPVNGNQSTYCDMVTYPLKNQNGEIVRIIEIWRDITEELSSRWKKRIKALETDFKKLVQEDRMISLGKLVASSVHEINNPIQGLLTFSHLMQEILKEGEPNATDLKEFQNYLALMSSELERCGNIVSGLLSFSRQSVLEYINVDVNEVLAEVISLTRHKMELQDIRLKTRLSHTPLVVHGDVNQLQQCFLNLIFNAVESMPRGGQLNVISKSDHTRRDVLVEFTDTGCGIHEDNMDHIFDPFFTTKAEGEGTGLGLSIVYGIIKAHKGDIKVHSRIGKGSSFLLKFPCAVAIG